MNSRIYRILLGPALLLAACSQAFAQLGTIITSQPQNVLNLVVGNNATFQVSAASTVTTNLEYQWFKNGVRIPGATGSKLTIGNALATDCGAFTCRINDGVSLMESSSANLTVNILTLVGDILANTLGLTGGQVKSSNAGAASSPGQPEIIPGDPGGSTMWYQWTPVLGGVATFTTQGSDFDTILGVYTGSPPNNLTPVPSVINDDDGGGYLCSRVSFNASTLTAYWISVDGYYGAQGNVVLTWNMTLLDSLPSASTTPAAATASTGTAVKLSSPWGRNCDWLVNGSVVAANTSSITVNPDDAGVGSYVARFTSSGGSVAYARPTSLQANVLGDGTTATNAIAWNKFLDSANSAFAQTKLPLKRDGGDSRGYSVSQVFSTRGNSDEPGEPIVCNQDGGSPGWFTYVAPVSGTMVISTAGSTFNTIVGAYIGPGNSFSSLTGIGCGYTTNYIQDGQPVVVIPNVPAHQTNFIVVEGEGGASGTVHLNINLGAPAAINLAPTNQAAGPGTNVTLVAGTTGASPLNVFWQLNGTNIPRATNGILTISNLQASSAGTYTFVASNMFATVYTQAVVSLIQPPAIVNQPTNQISTFGSAAAFTCAATGDAPLVYQWRHNGTNCACGTNSCLAFTNVQIADAGSYSCAVTNQAGVVVSSAASLMVNQASPFVSWSGPAPISYGTALTAAQLNATANVPGSFSYTPASGTVLSAGAHTLSVLFTPNDAVDYSTVTNSVGIVVSPAPLNLTANNRGKTYGQSVVFAGTEFTALGLLNGDTVSSVTLTSSGAAATASVAGSPYSITPSAAAGSGLGNYTITYNSGALTVNLAALTITASNRAKTYGQTVAFAGTEFLASGLMSSDSVSSVMLASAGTNATASVASSPYSITPSGAIGSGLSNYSIVYSNGTLAVSPAALMITASNRSKTYGQTVSFAGTEFSANGLLNNDSIGSVTLASAGTNAAATVVGSPYNIAPIGAIGTGLGNYSIIYSNGALTVNPAALTITASNRAKTYGQTIAFAGTEFAASGLVNSDSVGAVVLASSGAASNATVAGSPYAITVGSATGVGLANYNINYANGILTVGTATASATWSNPAPVIYGTPLNASQLNATANVPGTFSYSPLIGSVLNAGTNLLSVIFTPFDTSDYTGATNTASLVITTAPLTVTVGNASRNYGETNPSFAAIIIGLTNGDNITVSNSTSAAAGSPPGKYAIVPALVDPNNRQANYSVTMINGTLSVGQAAPTLTWTNPAPIVYGAPLGANQLSATASVTGAWTYTPSGGSVLNAGTNVLSVVFVPLDSTDYSSVTDTVSLVVAPAPLTVSASNFTRSFGAVNPIFTGTLSGLTNGDYISANYNCSAAPNSSVGGYAVAPSLVDPGNRQTNYAVTIVNGMLTITQAVPVLTWNNPAPINYGTGLTSAQLNATANVPGSYAYTPAAGTVLSAGSHALSAVFTPADPLNYAGGTSAVTLMVTASQSPPLLFSRQNGLLSISWPTNAAGFQLETTSDLSAPWTSLPGGIVLGDQNVVTVSMTGVSGYFRLKNQ